MSLLEDLDAPPARVLPIREASVGLDAVVVIDHEIFPVAGGGTRMVPDVTEEEVVRLARAMTWKFAVCGSPLAGAKAGIRFGGGDRDAVLSAYFEAIEPWRNVFLTGPDMGTAPEDFLAYDAPGDHLPMWARSHDGMSMDDLAVGHGVKAAAEVALARVGRTLAGATVAIEGFGKVGAGTARACARAGARVVAVSTIEGALIDPDGLDVDAVLELRGTHGDCFVAHASLPRRPKEALFSVPCDVLVPGARPDAISRESASALRCGAIVPVANIPYAEGATDVLHGRGVLALPDFVTNAGGVHLYESPACRDGEDAAACLQEVERLIAETTTRVLDAADEEGSTPTDAALGLARAFLRRAASERAEAARRDA